jgi:hypothetical protein
MEASLSAAPPAPPLRHPGFAYWIIGYQGFIEPIVRAALDKKLFGEGYLPLLTRTVKRQDLDRAAALLEGGQWSMHLSEAEAQALCAQLSQQSRLQLDLAYERGSGVVIGEIKCWAGYGAFDEKMARSMFFRGRDALLFLLREIDGKTVEKVVLVMWGRQSAAHESIRDLLVTRYGIPVEIEYIEDLLTAFPPHEVIDMRIGALRETCEDITSWLMQFGAAVPGLSA